MTPQDKEYRLIALTQGQFAKVSPPRFEELSRTKWCAVWNKATRSFYVVHNSWGITTQMGRHILGLCRGDKRTCDHVNHDTLDNTDENLRVATPLQQQHNTRQRKDNKSGYRGVFWDQNKKLWRANIHLNGKTKHLGSRASAERAYHELYLPAAIEHFGEFACLEVPCSRG